MTCSSDSLRPALMHARNSGSPTPDLRIAKPLFLSVSPRQFRAAHSSFGSHLVPHCVLPVFLGASSTGSDAPICRGRTIR